MKKYNLVVLLLVVVGLPLGVWAQTVRDYEYYYNRGSELLKYNRDSGNVALKLFDSALILEPKSWEAYRGKGLAEIHNGRIVECIQYLDSAINYADMNHKISIYELKEFYVSRNKFYDKKEALKVFKEAIDAFPDSSRVYIDRSFYYCDIKQYKEAMTDARTALKVNPCSGNYFEIAQIMQASKQYSFKEIIKLYDECVRKHPEAWSYNYRGKAYYNEAERLLNDKDSITNKKVAKEYLNKSLLDFDKMILIDTTNFYLYADRIKAKIATSLFNEEVILNDFTYLQKRFPDKIYSYELRASYYASIKQYKKAIEDLNKLTIAQPYIASYYTEMADFKDLSGDYKSKDIIADLDLAINIHNKSNWDFDQKTYDRLKAKYGKQ